MVDPPERERVTIRLSNISQTDASPLLSLPCPPLPNFGVGGVLRSAEQDADVEMALANDPVALQLAVELLRNTDLSYLCALGPFISNLSLLYWKCCHGPLNLFLVKDVNTLFKLTTLLRLVKPV